MTAATNNAVSPIRKLSDLASLALAGIGAGEFDFDAQLVRRCKKGDMDAYRQLVERHERRVMSILTRIVPAGQPCGQSAHMVSDLDDLAQEVFVQAWRALPSFRGDARFSTWLYRIATNRAIKEWRRGQKQPGDGWCDADIERERWPADGARQHGYDPEAIVQLGARDNQLRDAVDALPEKQRTVILLHYFEEYSCEEIAQILDCSVGTVWSRLHYACRRLRATLSAADTAWG